MKSFRFEAIAVILAVGLMGPDAWAASVLLVTDNSGWLTSEESNTKSLLESGGYTVNTIWDGASQTAFNTAFGNNNAVYIPASVTSTDLGNKLRLAPIGVVNEEVAYMSELGLCSSDGSTTTVSSISISTNTHFVTSPFATGFFSLGWSSYAVARVAGTTASGAVVLATVGGTNSIVAVPAGGTLANTINGNSVASGRRIQMPLEMGVVNVSSLTSNATNLLMRIVQWAARLDERLEARWKLDEASGTSAADSSGNSHTGTVTGTASWAPAVLNNGFSFNGSTRIQASGLMNMPESISIAAWANLTVADSAGAEVVSIGDHFLLRLDEAGAAKVAFYNGSSYVTLSHVTTFAGSGWHHFVAVMDDANNVMKLYVDGQLAASMATTASISYSGLGGNTVIGRHGNGATNRDFTGQLDDVRVYTYALSDSQVAEVYGLVGRWRLNETSGTTAADSTPLASNGLVTGATNWSSDCGGMGALDFSGSGNYVRMTNAPHLQPSGMLSIAAWIKGDSWGAGTDNDTILRKGEDNPNNYALAVSDGRLELLLDGSDGFGIRSNTVLSTGQWYHVAATWDGATARLYINGQLDHSAARAGTIGSDSRPLYIGGRASADYFDGMLRDVRLYNRPLTSGEVSQLASTAGHWLFSEGSGTTAADSSGGGNNATLTGGATWTSDCAGNHNALLTNGAGGIAQTAGPVNPPDTGTLAFWMRSTGAPAGTARILGLGGDWEVRQNPDGRVISDLCGDGGTLIGTVTPLTEVGRWYHFAATFDSSNDTYAIYVDGQLESSGTNPAAMSQQPAGVLSFGTRTGSTEYWSGALRDVRIYGRKLCSNEIAELYGLGGHWKLDETSGSLAADSSSFGRHAAVVGTPTWTPGAVDGCLQLNGATRVEVNSLMGSPRNVTLAAWANLTAADTGGAEVISLGDCFAIRLNEGSSSRAFFYNGSGWVSVAVSQTFAGTGWHHFAAVFNDDQNYCKLYIDGVEAASLATGATISYTGLGTKLVVGAHGNGGTTWDFTGKIDDVRVYTRALCPADIQTLHDLGSGAFSGVKIIKWVEIQ